MLRLFKVLYPEIHSCISFDSDGITIEIESNMSINLNIDKKSKKAVATLDAHVTCREKPTMFKIDVKAVGLFYIDVELETEEQKKELHIEAYNSLFPYVQGTVSELTTKAGLQPLILEKSVLKLEDIKIN